MDETKLATIGDVCRFFGMKLGDFRREWEALSAEAKAQLRTGIGNGTLTY